LIYAVGDIHGEHWKLVQLLAKLPLTPEDRLVFIGDYIDRGPESRQVLELLVGLKDQRPDTIFLRGNHEQMMLDARKHKEDFMQSALWFGNGGSETVDSYPKSSTGWIERIPDEHWQFLEKTEMEFREGPYIFVHAGLLPPKTRWPYAEEPRLWVRHEFLRYRGDFGGVVVFGHTPQKTGRPLVEPNKIGIDTAVAFGGPLTAVGLSPDGSTEPLFYQV
jgi:serine/threonine protein phosphatase 1